MCVCVCVCVYNHSSFGNVCINSWSMTNSSLFLLVEISFDRGILIIVGSRWHNLSSTSTLEGHRWREDIFSEYTDTEAARDVFERRCIWFLRTRIEGNAEYKGNREEPKGKKYETFETK